MWDNNEIQFTRLLAEISLIDLTDKQNNRLCEMMGLNRKELSQLFQRAILAFDKIKADI